MPSKSPTLLITGFEPFAGSTLNPSQVIVEYFAGKANAVEGLDLRSALLPVDTRRVAAAIDALWAEHDPQLVLHFGESAKATHLTLERIAVNLLDFDTPDNTGQKITDQPIDPAGPAARFVTLPVRSMLSRLESQGVGARLSLSAGAYLCNQTLYLSLAQAEQRGGRAVGFIHVPSLHDQVQSGERPGPGMPRQALIDAVELLVRQAAQMLIESTHGVYVDPKRELR